MLPLKMSKGLGQRKLGTFWGGRTLKLAGSQAAVKEAKASLFPRGYTFCEFPKAGRESEHHLGEQMPWICLEWAYAGGGN